MVGAFDITTTVTNLKLPATRKGQLIFTITNTSGRPLTMRGLIVTPQSTDQKAWFGIVGDVERPSPPGVALQYEVNIAVPPSAPAGPVIVRFDAIAREDPDAYATAGPSVVVEVPAVVIPPVHRSFPWWIIAAVVAAVLLLGGGGYGVYRLVSSNNKPPVVKASPSPSQVVPLSLQQGVWTNVVTNPADPGPRSFTIEVAGGTVMGKPLYSVCINAVPTWCLIDGMSAPGTYDASHQAYVFTWTTSGGDKVVGTATLDPAHQMILTMTWDGVHATTYVLSPPPCGPKCIVFHPPTAISNH